MDTIKERLYKEYLEEKLNLVFNENAGEEYPNELDIAIAEQKEEEKKDVPSLVISPNDPRWKKFIRVPRKDGSGFLIPPSDGIGLVSSYPGTPSTEITEFLAKHDDIHSEWAPNEKVAMETAFGASLAGMRSVCAMKHVGLNVAADPLFTLSYTGITGGMVVCVADDPAMHSSQNEQDSRHYAIAAKVPMLEPSDSAEAYEFAKSAFELSEKFDTPVLLRMCTRIAHSQCVVDIGEREDVPVKE